MKTIKFSDSELEFLRNHYELELTDAETYVAGIKNILIKLGAQGKPSEEEPVVKKRPGRPPRSEQKMEQPVPAPVPAERKKPGPKPKSGSKKTAKKGKPGPKKKSPPEQAVEQLPVTGA